jgi:hypothetical protein
MKLLRLAVIFTFIVGVGTLYGQTSGILEASLTWSNSTCASTITLGTGGAETSGPCTAQVYRATIANGASCPAYSSTAYSVIDASVAQNAPAGAYTDPTTLTNTTYCYVVADTFASGGGQGPVSSPFSLYMILTGTPGAVTGLSGTIKPGV